MVPPIVSSRRYLAIFGEGLPAMMSEGFPLDFERKHGPRYVLHAYLNEMRLICYASRVDGSSEENNQKAASKKRKAKTIEAYECVSCASG